MPLFVETVDEQGAEGEVRELYEADRRNLGYVANYTKAFSLRPEVLRAWQGLNKAVKANMELRHYELATLAAATALGSSYCSLAHGRVLRQFFGDAQLGAVARDFAHAGLEPGEVALMAHARKVALHAEQVTEDDVEALRSHGFSDAAILDITLAAAARCFFSKVLGATGARPDAAYLELEPDLREALTVGRPIEDRQG